MRLFDATYDGAPAVIASAPGRVNLIGEHTDYNGGEVLPIAIEQRTHVAVRPKGRPTWRAISAAGLSSSAVLEVATALALVSLPGVRAPERAAPALDALARLSQRAEVEYVGVNSGIMDQFASALGARGQAVHVWCDTGTFEHVPMPDELLIFDTAVPRALRDSAYNTRRAECDAALATLQRLDPTLPNLAAAHSALLDAAELPAPLE